MDPTVLVAIGGLAAAAASAVAAVMSWRAAHAANQLNVQHWDEEKRQAALAARRDIGVDIEQWLNGMQTAELVAALKPGRRSLPSSGSNSSPSATLWLRAAGERARTSARA